MGLLDIGQPCGIGWLRTVMMSKCMVGYQRERNIHVL